MVKGFSKIYNFSFFGQIFFGKHFYYITGFCDKKFNFCKFVIFLQILKVEHKSWFSAEIGLNSWEPAALP